MLELTTVLSVLISFAISAAMGPFVIPYLRKLKFGQTVRDDGPQSHLKKNGTPTMGGVMILTAFTVTTLIFIPDRTEMIPIIFLTLGFGIIGFLDDYIKVVKKRSLGLRAWQKMGLQFLVTGIFAWYLVGPMEMNLAMKVPFMEGTYLDFGWFNIPILFFIVLGTVNGTNFTDGLDGLASSVTVVVAGFFAIASIWLGSYVEPAGCAMAGALLGFLLYNVHPAQVFMGDTGSLALGGFVAGIAYVMEMPIFIVLIGFIYALEVVSVIMQVSYFKMTHGKRIFKMAPIHHHFELCGWSETKVVAIFTIVTGLIGLVAMMGIW